MEDFGRCLLHVCISPLILKILGICDWVGEITLSESRADNIFPSFLLQWEVPPVYLGILSKYGECLDSGRKNDKSVLHRKEKGKLKMK